MQAQPDEVVVVQGPGHQGLVVVQALLAAGVERVIVTGTADDGIRLDKAIELGVEATIDVTTVNPVTALAERTGGMMADVVFDAAPLLWPPSR